MRVKGLRQFVSDDLQSQWKETGRGLLDREDRMETVEQRFRYSGRFNRLLQLPQADAILEILGLYGGECIPVPRLTERFYWSVSCLASSPDKPLARVNASWMELFSLFADGDDLRSRFIVHLSDFTCDGSTGPEELDLAFLESAAEKPGDVRFSVWSIERDIGVIWISGAASIQKFMGSTRALRGIRSFNLTHMNRGRNAYQASHCHSLADFMVEAPSDH